MRNTGIKVGLFMCALLFVATKPVHAGSLDNLSLIENPLKPSQVQDQREATQLQKDQKHKEEQEKEKQKHDTQEAPTPPAPQQHTVTSGETLSSVAAQYGVSWNRLFDKNTEIADPNVISVGITLTIPEATEQLPERVAPIAAPVAIVARSTTSAVPSRTVRPSSSAGNTYAPGYCTWYAKNRRPDLPNRLGNASSWVANAAAQGFATGTAPQAGAIGQQGNHVVYVESVNGDGTVTVSDMNYAGLYVVTTRTVAASSFRYIY